MSGYVPGSPAPSGVGLAAPAPRGVVDRGAGPVVVLVHGAGGSAATSFVAAVPALARRHRVLSFDLTSPTLPWTIDAVADDLARAVRERTDDPVLLVGHSLGAAVAARAAVRHDDLAHGVLLAAAPCAPDPRRTLVTRLWRRLFDLDRTALAEHLVLTTMSPGWLAGLTDADVADLVALAADLVPEATGHHLDVAATTDLAADLHRLTLPVTAVLGEDDPLVAVGPWRDAASAGLAHVHVWSGGHDVLTQNTEPFTTLVDRLTPTHHAPIHHALHGRNR